MRANSLLRLASACCAACGEPYGHIRSDDAAPWLTILVVGHLAATPTILEVLLIMAGPVTARLLTDERVRQEFEPLFERFDARDGELPIALVTMSANARAMTLDAAIDGGLEIDDA